jgi:hypothetical protein
MKRPRPRQRKSWRVRLEANHEHSTHLYPDHPTHCLLILSTPSFIPIISPLHNILKFLSANKFLISIGELLVTGCLYTILSIYNSGSGPSSNVPTFQSLFFNSSLPIGISTSCQCHWPWRSKAAKCTAGLNNRSLPHECI